MSIPGLAIRRSALLVVVLLAAMSSPALADISGSAHDFSDDGWNPTGEICVTCHTPHDADTTVADAPLWNHEVTTAIYTVYDSPTMDATPGQPGPVSRLCLSCHDGTVALDSFGGASGGSYIGSEHLIDTDLSDDHPVGIDWEHQTLEPFNICGNCHDIHGVTSYIGPPMFDGKVECATCHDVHNQGAPEPNLLRRTIAGSQLCLWCHGK